MRNYLIFLFVMLSLMSFASAWDWDNVVAETGLHPKTGLPTFI